MRKKKAVSDAIYIASYNPRNRTVQNERLDQIFSDVGRRYGYDDVKAKFELFPDFKIMWERSYKWAEFGVSDYLDRAPDEVLIQLAESVFERISGKQQDYGEALFRYFEDVRDQNTPDYLQRKRLNPDSIGRYHDFNDCVNRLREQGLSPPRLAPCWAHEGISGPFGPLWDNPQGR